jgi:hypothetical protein
MLIPAYPGPLMLQTALLRVNRTERLGTVIYGDGTALAHSRRMKRLLHWYYSPYHHTLYSSQ